MSQSEEIARLMRDNGRLAAQVESQRAEIGTLRRSIPPLLVEGDRLVKQVEVLTEHIRKARRQRNAYRSWADRLAEWLSSYNGDDRVFMEYLRWRDQP